VFARSRVAACFAALTGALALAGCVDNSAQWFAQPLVKTNKNYTYSQLEENKQSRPIMQSDLVDANGGCPSYVAPAPAQGAAANPGDALPADQAALIGAGVALGMSECDVVSRLGQANAVNLGQYPNGQRSAVLTYNGGPRPGVYRFESGRLSEMDRVEAPPPPPAPEKKTAKKKTPKPANPGAPSANAGDKS
jgi:hypothetical protein